MQLRLPVRGRQARRPHLPGRNGEHTEHEPGLWALPQGRARLRRQAHRARRDRQHGGGADRARHRSGGPIPRHTDGQAVHLLFGGVCAMPHCRRQGLDHGQPPGACRQGRATVLG